MALPAEAGTGRPANLSAVWRLRSGNHHCCKVILFATICCALQDFAAVLSILKEDHRYGCSNLELIFEPQPPVPPADTVLQGYFLSITNLEDVDLTFQLECVTSPVSAPTRTLANNTLAIVDVAEVNNDFSFALTGAPNASVFALRPAVFIPAQATAKIALLPRDPFPAPQGDGTADPADYEARGYTRLRLLGAAVRIDGRTTIRPQLDRPARVLLTPQNRATYLGPGGEVKGQTQAGLPLASGAAGNEITPEATVSIDVGDLPDFETRLPELDDILARGMATLPIGLVIMLEAAQAAGFDLRSFYRALRDAGIGMVVETRKLANT